MKMKSLILLALATGCGLVAMLGVQQILSGDRKPTAETGKVLVAFTSIMPGQPLDDSNVTFKDWPLDKIPKGAVTSQEQYTQRSLRVPALPDEPIMVAKLNEKGVFGGSSEIPKGMRVATVPVDVTKTHSGLIMPGDRVDVVVTYTLQQQGSRPIQKAKAILQYIEVFATDNIRQSGVPNSPNSKNEELNTKNISLIVTPDQYNVIMLAEAKGKLSLALRHRGDNTQTHAADVDETMFDNLHMTRGQDKKSDDGADGPEEEKKIQAAKSAKVAAKEPEKPTWTLKIYDGDKLREEQIELPEEPTAASAPAANSGGKWPEFFHNLFRKSL